MKKTTILLITTLFITTAFAQELNFSGDLSTMWGVTAPSTKNAGNFSIGKTDFTGTFEAYMGNGTVLAEGTIGYDAITNSFQYGINEAYIDYSDSFWGFRIGQQKAVWGKADGVNITNSVFPSDSTTLFNDDSALAVTAARVSFSGSFFTVDAYWIPFFKGTELPLDEGNPLRKALIPDSVTMNVMESELVLPIQLGNLAKPELKLENSEYGLKASAYFSICDVSLYGFYGWDKTPLMNYKIQTVTNPLLKMEIPTGITINGEYKRLTMIGVDAAFPVGETVLRLESAFFPERSMQASTKNIMAGDENFVKQNQLMALAGIDWMPSSWTITAQYYCDVIMNKSDKIQRQDAYTHGATLSVSKTLLQETLEFSLNGMIGFNAFDSVINFSTKYSLSDQIKLSAGTYVFLPGPEKDGEYGAFKDLSTIYLKCQYSF